MILLVALSGLVIQMSYRAFYKRRHLENNNEPEEKSNEDNQKNEDDS